MILRRFSVILEDETPTRNPHSSVIDNKELEAMKIPSTLYEISIDTLAHETFQEDIPGPSSPPRDSPM